MSVHDEALAMRVKNALAMDKRVSSLPIEVRVSKDEVFLKGRTESMEQVDVVQFIASGIPGVRHVNTDEIQVGEEER
jgi:osmotically-inducible protein OsmY